MELQEYLLPFGPERFIFASAIHYVPSPGCIVCVTQSLTVREEQRLTVFEDTVPMKKFGFKRK
jgi:hydrogenase maturation factor